MEKKRYRCIAFDAVGTLITPVPSAGEVYFQTARRFGSRLAADEIARRFKQAFRDAERDDAAAAHEARLVTSEDREHERWRQVVAHVIDDIPDTVHCFDHLFSHFAQPDSWRCFDDVPEVLDRLEADGYSLAVASNFDRRLHAVCDGFPALQKIGVRVISSEVGFRKPGRGFFAALVAQAGCDANDVLMVGDDAANDVAGARQAGLGAVLINRRGEAGSDQRSPDQRSPDEIGSLSEVFGLL
jgi:putative hydrolase of the HAD superfamily